MAVAMALLNTPTLHLHSASSSLLRCRRLINRSAFAASTSCAVLRNTVTGVQFLSQCIRNSSRSSRTMDIHALAVKSSAVANLPSLERKVLVPIANGSEEMEAVILIDVLRRAGAEVTVASVEEDVHIKASRGVHIVADTLVSDCEAENYDLVVLPGGMLGAERLRDSAVLKKITEKQAKSQKAYAAICAAPVVTLQAWGLLQGLHATCHPSFAGKLENAAAVESHVVRDNILTTSRAPGTAFEFALALVEQLYDSTKVSQVSGPMVLPVDDGMDTGKLKFNEQKWSTSAVPQVLVPVANGSEEMEVVIIVDVLRRAGAKVTVASVESDTIIVASRSVKLMADTLLADVHDTALFVDRAGGMPGAERLKSSEKLTKILQDQVKGGRIYGAICAAPAVVLQDHEFLQGKKATCHPSFISKLEDQSAVDGRVVIDGLLITSRGPGTAMEFALSIVEKLFDHHKSQEIAEAMVFEYL